MPKSPDPTDKHVGSRVRMRPLMLGLSQTKLADALGLTFQQVQKYEKGANRISASKLQHTSSFLQVPISFFFEGLSDPSNTAKHPAGVPTPAHIGEFIATTDGLSLIRAYTQIKRRNLRHAIVALVETLAG
jgi:transcriptional regulator with XRE-family HTH domain